MEVNVKLNPDTLNELRKVDARLVSYNVEMTEVTGGTFWKEYTPEQIAGIEEFPPLESLTDISILLQVYPPVDLYHSRIRKLAKELGPVWIRVSGSWATKTYFDLDNHTNGIVPEGFQSVLTEEQWKGVLDFVKEVDAKLLVSVANCEGIHAATGKWEPDQTKLLFDYSINYGAPISAIEFMNEPNILEMSGAPKGYTGEDYCRDQDACNAFIRENYPGVLIVGPCGTGDRDETNNNTSAIMNNMPFISTADIMKNTKIRPDAFSYHYYNGLSERVAVMGGHWPGEAATTEEYLAVSSDSCSRYIPIRDEYCPNAPIWVTESGDAGGGGNTWGSTYLDVLRTLNELGGFATMTDGVIFHNTLASSDYGFLKHGTFEPRPNYFAVLLWNRIMGTTVYDTKEPICEGAHVYAHSRRDGKDGVAYLVINNSKTETTSVELPKDAEIYELAGQDGDIRATVMTLNGNLLVLGEGDELPELSPVVKAKGVYEVAPATCTFIVM